MGLFVNQKVSRNPHFFLCIENEIAMGIRNVMGQRWDKTSTNSRMVHHLMAIGNVDLMGFNGISLIYDGKTYEIPLDPINDGVNLGAI